MNSNSPPHRYAVSLLERSISLLRTSGLEGILLWLTATVPFVLAVIYHWTLWTTHPRAPSYVFQGSLLLTLAYVWMKALQGLLGQKLLASARRVSWGIPGPGTVFREAFPQIRIQSTGLVLLPLSGLLALPLGWTFAFYHLYALTGKISEAYRLACLRPKANHILISYFTLMALIVFFNVLVGLFFLPRLVQIFTGLDSIILENPTASLNGTLLLTAAGLSYLCLGPLVRGAYTLWLFDAESQSSGTDLLIRVADLQKSEVQER